MIDAAPAASDFPILLFQDPQTPESGGQGNLVRRGDAPAMTGEPGTVQQDPAGDPPPNMQEQCFSQLPIVIGFVAIFYFLILRPSQKQEKKRKKLIAAIKKGDRVVTNSGLHGVISNLTDDIVTLRVDKDVKMAFDRTAISRVVAPDDAAANGGS